MEHPLVSRYLSKHQQESREIDIDAKTIRAESTALKSERSILAVTCTLTRCFNFLNPLLFYKMEMISLLCKSVAKVK